MTQNDTIDQVEIRREYYKSGALYSEGPYMDGVEHGIERGYHKSGDLWWETPCVNGDRHGIAKHYNRDILNIDCVTLYKSDREVLELCLESYGTVTIKS